MSEIEHGVLFLLPSWFLKSATLEGQTNQIEDTVLYGTLSCADHMFGFSLSETQRRGWLISVRLYDRQCLPSFGASQ